MIDVTGNQQTYFLKGLLLSLLFWVGGHLRYSLVYSVPLVSLINTETGKDNFSDFTLKLRSRKINIRT